MTRAAASPTSRAKIHAVGEETMTRITTLICVALLLLASAQLALAGRLRAVMYVGGGFHDYKQMPADLAEQISKRADIQFDIRHIPDAAHMAAEFKSPSFGKDCDVIIYDICFGEAWSDGDYDAALKVATAGKPAVFIHCSMHTYRPPRNKKDPKLAEREAIADAKWHALVGMDTRVHDKYEAFSTVKVADHPITRAFPADWRTAGDELYNTVKMMPTATPLLTAKSPISGKVHTVAWINDYHGTRVFCTTLGHDMKTGADPAYLQLLTNGILWTCGRLDANGNV
jgi:hypothetical protein